MDKEYRYDSQVKRLSEALKHLQAALHVIEGARVYEHCYADTDEEYTELLEGVQSTYAIVEGFREAVDAMAKMQCKSTAKMV